MRVSFFSFIQLYVFYLFLYGRHRERGEEGTVIMHFKKEIIIQCTSNLNTTQHTHTGWLTPHALIKIERFFSRETSKPTTVPVNTIAPFIHSFAHSLARSFIIICFRLWTQWTQTDETECTALLHDFDLCAQCIDNNNSVSRLLQVRSLRIFRFS